MKKLLFIITLFFAFVTFSEAQIATTHIATGNTMAEYTTDVTLTNAVAQYWYIVSKQHEYTAQVLVIDIDSLAGNHTNVAIQLQGRYTANDAWTNVGSAINWKGEADDTTIVYTNATENGYRQWKVLFTGTGTGTSTIENIFFKQWFGIP